jgi:hypothetical protein
MQRNEINSGVACKLLLTWICTASYILGSGADAGIYAMHFIHANVFHLAGNLLCLWWMPVSLTRLLAGYALAVACAALCPPCVGLSGVLFAIIGMAYGERRPKGVWRCLLFCFAAGLLPGMALMFHLSTLLTGYVAGAYTRIARR